MDGKGCYRDNIFVERLWRTAKYGCLYLQAFRDGQALRRGLKSYFERYNHERCHQGLDEQAPDEVYLGSAHWKRTARSLAFMKRQSLFARSGCPNDGDHLSPSG
jgi:transposase InsO family protein